MFMPSQTQSHFPKQSVSRAQAKVVYRSAVQVARKACESAGETFDKNKFDAHLTRAASHLTKRGNNHMWAWASSLLDQVEAVLTVKTYKTTDESEQAGAFLTGGHTFVDREEAASVCASTAKEAGLSYIPGKITSFAL